MESQTSGVFQACRQNGSPSAGKSMHVCRLGHGRMLVGLFIQASLCPYSEVANHQLRFAQVLGGFTDLLVTFTPSRVRP